MRPVLQTAQVQQDEGKLERPPPGPRLRRGIAALPSPALAGGAGDRLVHRAEGKAGVSVAVQQGNALFDAVARLPGRVDQTLRCRLTRRAGDADNPLLLRFDPSLVVDGQVTESVAQCIGSPAASAARSSM